MDGWRASPWPLAARGWPWHRSPRRRLNQSNTDPNADFRRWTYSWLQPAGPLPHAGAVSNPARPGGPRSAHRCGRGSRADLARAGSASTETDVRVVATGAERGMTPPCALLRTRRLARRRRRPTMAFGSGRGTIIVDMVFGAEQGDPAGDGHRRRTERRRKPIERINQAMKCVFERFPLPVQKKR